VPHVPPEAPNDPGEVRNVLQEPGDDRSEVFDDQLKVALGGSERMAVNIPGRGFRCGSDCTGLFLAAGGDKKPDGSMMLLTWNTCRLLTGGRELALVNLLQSTGADVATITECEIPEGSGGFSVAGYTNFAPPPNAGGKTRVLVLVKNDLALRANVKVIANIMDPAVQSVWLHFSHHSIGSATQGATLGAFILGGIYRELTPLLNWEESMLRLGLLLSQISKATEHGVGVADVIETRAPCSLCYAMLARPRVEHDIKYTESKTSDETTCVRVGVIGTWR
jgi:hypothetical protein